MLKNFTVTEKAHFITDKNRHKKSVIFNSENLSLTFQELFKHIEKISSRSESNKTYGLPRLYQVPRNSSIELDYILEDDSIHKEDYINILTLDFDGNTISKNNFEFYISEYEYISYYSFSNDVKDGGERYRVIINLESDVLWKRFTKNVKESILEMFKFGGKLADTASIKNGFMLLPCLYDGVREPELVYNKGKKRLDLNKIIDKIELEQMVTKETRSKIVENINDEKGFNIDRQNNSIEKLKIELEQSYYDGNRHNALTTFISKSCLVGVDDSTIRNVIYDFETDENKIEKWIDLITKWKVETKVSNYYYQFEYRVFEGEYFLYDNLNDRYEDPTKPVGHPLRWLAKNPPRNSLQKDIKFAEENIFYKALLVRLNNRYDLARKMFSFITQIMERYNPTDMVDSVKYDFKINRGVAFSKRVTDVIMFDLGKFKDIDKDIVGTYASMWDVYADINKDMNDDQKLMLSVLKELVWCRCQKIESNGYFGWRKYFSPKPTLIKIWG